MIGGYASTGRLLVAALNDYMSVAKIKVHWKFKTAWLYNQVMRTKSFLRGVSDA
jgi:hypothetical protein